MKFLCLRDGSAVSGSSPQYQDDLHATDRFFCKADGLCYIEPELQNRNVPARASQSEVAAAAKVVIDGCIRDKADPKGGSADHISEFLRSSL